MTQEGKGELASMGNALHAAPEAGHGFLHAIGTEIGHLAPLHVAPDSFGRIEIGSVSR